MRKGNRIYGIIAVLLLSLGACSLIHDDMEDCQLYTSEGVPYAYVAVAFNTGMNTSTRADENDLEDPTGGESGDGEEPGQSNENQVHDITLFFYDTGTNPDANDNPGVNMPANTKIVARHHFATGKFTHADNKAETNPVEVEQLLVNHSYHVLAVVNGGDFLADKPIDELTLGDLQQMKVTSIYETSGSNPTQARYSNFLMASADDENYPLVIYPNNSETNPAHTVINVERVSARVDYRASGNIVDEPGFYEVKLADEVVGKAKITGAMLMNVLDAEAPSWLLKRVADSWEKPVVEYLGKEKAQENGAASNYVIDAMPSKTKDDFVQDTYFKNFGYENLAWESQFIEGSLIDDLAENYNCIGYPKENVNQLGDKGLTTGVVFRAQYRPYINNDYLDENQTFFEYNGKVYATLEALMDGLYENSSNLPTWDNLKQTFTNTISTWESLRSSFITALRDDPVGYRSYLISKSDEEGTVGSIPEDVKATLAWDYYLEHECFYKEVEGKAVVDYSKSSDVPSGTTRRILHNISGMSTYKNGICYYTYWIKHANDQDKNNDLVGVKDKTGGVMEYAIVRNNLYKLDVTSITGPGGDIPGDRNVNVNVLVEDWIMLPEEDINLNPAVNTEEEGA